VALSDRRPRSPPFGRESAHSLFTSPTAGVANPIGVVVAALGAAHFVAHENHGHARGERRRGEEVLDLADPQLLDGE